MWKFRRLAKFVHSQKWHERQSSRTKKLKFNSQLQKDFRNKYIICMQSNRQIWREKKNDGGQEGVAITNVDKSLRAEMGFIFLKSNTWNYDFLNSSSTTQCMDWDENGTNSGNEIILFTFWNKKMMLRLPWATQKCAFITLLVYLLRCGLSHYEFLYMFFFINITLK